MRREATDTFVAVGWDEVLDRLAAELARVYGGPGPEAVFGGSYGWSSAGRFHHAQSQVHRFLNCLGGYVRSLNTYSVGTSEVVLPRIFGGRADLLRSLTAWPLIAAHTELLVCFGGIPAKNLAVAPGGVTEHRSVAHLTELVRRGGEVVLAGPDRADRAAWARRPVAPRASGHRCRADGGAVPGAGRRRPARRRVPRHALRGRRRGVGLPRRRADGVDKTPGWAAAICGVPADAIVALAREMAAKHTMVTVSWSLQRAEHGEQPVWAGVLLAALLGRIGLPGAGFGHGYGSMADSGVPMNDVGPPTLPQLVNPVRTAIPVARVADMLLSPGGAFTYNGERHRYPYIELVYWSGGNPFHHHQDLARLRRAFRAVSTVVVHEPYWTATARHADIVLPATVTLERDDIGASRTDPYLTAMHRHAPPYAQARDDYTTFSALAERLGVADTFTEGRDAAGWLRHLYDQWRARYGRPGLRHVLEGGAGGAQPAAARACSSPTSAPTRRRTRCGTPSGRIELRSATVAGFGLADCPGHPVWLEPGEWHGAARAAGYPLVLLANNPSSRLHSQLDFGPYSAADKVAGPRAAADAPRRRRRPRAGRRRGSSASSTTAAPAWRACASTTTLLPGRGPDVDRRLVLPGGGPGRRARAVHGGQRQRAHPRRRLVGAFPGLRGRPRARRGAALGRTRPAGRERDATPVGGARTGFGVLRTPSDRGASTAMCAGRQRVRAQRRLPHQAANATGTAPSAPQANTAPYAPASAAGAATAVPIALPRKRHVANSATAVARSPGTISVAHVCRVVCRNAQDAPTPNPATVSVASDTDTAGTAHATTRHSPPMAAIPGELTRATSALTNREQATAPTPNAAATSPATAADRPSACTAGAT